MDPDFGRYEYRSEIGAFESAGIGITAGAAAGALIGTAVGTERMLTDQVSIQHNRYEALKPVLTGAHYTPESSTTNYTYDSNGQVNGFTTSTTDASWSANIANQRTGLLFDKPEFSHTHAWGPLQCAAAGTVIGGVVGGVAGALSSILTKRLGYTYAPFRETPGVLPAGGVGAGLGLLAGATLGALDQSHALTIHEQVTRPTYVNQQIGSLPHVNWFNELRPQMNGYDLNYPDGQAPFSNGQPVMAQVPTGQLEQATHHETSNTLTPLTGALAGTGLGFVTGVAISVTRNTLLKVGRNDLDH